MIKNLSIKKENRRDIAEYVEKSIVNYYRKQFLDLKERYNTSKFSHIPESILESKQQVIDTAVDYLYDAYGNQIRDLEQVGNTYNSVGDVQLFFEDGHLFFEIKDLNNPTGNGTLANVGVGIFNIIMQDLESWTKYEENQGLKRRRMEIASQFSGKDFKRMKDYYHTCGIIRDQAESGCVLASKIKHGIEELAKYGKRQYIDNYLLSYIESYRKTNSDFESQLEKLLKVLLNGVHRASMIKKELKSANKMDDFYKIMYLRAQKTGNIDIEVVNPSKCILGGIKDIRQNTSDGTAIVIETDFYIFTFALHYKNKFQGAQTPCINIFVKENLNS